MTTKTRNSVTPAKPTRKAGRPRKTAPVPATDKSGPAARSVIKPEYKKDHQPDEFARALSSAVAGDGGKVDLAKLRKVAEQNGVWSDRYETLNLGMARMNVSIRLRAKVRREEQIVWPTS